MVLEWRGMCIKECAYYKLSLKLVYLFLRKAEMLQVVDHVFVEWPGATHQCSSIVYHKVAQFSRYEIFRYPSTVNPIKVSFAWNTWEGFLKRIVWMLLAKQCTFLDSYV